MNNETLDFEDCYLPGWDDGPEEGLFCELADGHDGQHAAFADDPDPVLWDVTWVVGEEDFPFPTADEEDYPVGN